MMDEDSIQRAHDTLVAVLLGDVPLDYSDEAKRGMEMAVDVLCWILEHGNHDFSEALDRLEQNIKDTGFVIRKVKGRQSHGGHSIH